MVEGATAESPPRRRTSWSLKTIVEDVSGRPIDDFQDPGKPVHPYLRSRFDEPGPRAAATPENAPEPYDPVGRLYPPLVGARGREFHGAENEHHAETLERHRPTPPAPGERARLPGPLQRPERLYLHYLLLHMDRLSDSGLRYLRTAVDEEFTHRERSRVPDAVVEPPADPAVAPPAT